MRLWRSRCERRGHLWFPGNEQSPFIVSMDICLRGRCDAMRVTLPTADCLGPGGYRHPLAEHYTKWGHLKPHSSCPGPR